MYYHIGRCLAPCCGKICEKEYGVQVDRVRKLLAGETEALIAELTEGMRAAAQALEFEQAARLRNAVKAIGELSGTSTVVDFDREGRDYIAWAAEGVLSTFTVFSMRGGKMTGRELFRTRSAAEEDESLETFAASYYSPDHPPPAWIYLASAGSPGEDGPGNGENSGKNRDFSDLLKWFTGQFGYAPSLIFPEEKRHQAILAMARQNALEDIRRRLKERGAGPALDELARVLRLRTRPERIEGFDIAQLDGKHPVASLISFKEGVPDRKNYRYFKLRSVVGIVDDFAAMREAVHRRYSRLIREGRELPDLVLIDGGIGQVNAARGVLDELGTDVDVAALAKRDEEIWLPHAPEPIRLSKDSEALKVLQFVRDETHRFATSFNQRLRSKDLLFPALESVEGIGPKRAAVIMKAYGTIQAIAAAGSEELAERCGIGEKTARAVRAAALLALEDRAAAKKGFAEGTGRSAPRGRSRGAGTSYPNRESAASLAAQAAAEPEAAYYPEEEEQG
jgi:excinuclease ABC subunit C